MTTRIGMLAFPRLTQLDLTGPYEVFGRLPDAQVLLVGEGEARSDTGLRLRPDAGYSDSPQLDVLFVPGGPGVNAAMEDEALLRFLRTFPGVPVLLMSASIPPCRMAALREVLRDRVGEVIHGDPAMEGYQRYRLEPRISAAAA